MKTSHMTLAAALLLASASAAPAADDGAQGWISSPDPAVATKPVVLHFRRAVQLNRRPSAFPVRVSADNRFILFVNGARVASGPSVGDITHWREATIDLARWLRPGRNVIAATVWDGVKPLALPANATPEQLSAARGAALFTSTAPMFQQTIATGFRLIGEGDAAAFSTDRPGWRVQRDAGHGFGNGWKQVKRWYYVAGNPETIDATSAQFDPAGPQETGTGWQDAAPAPAAARTLVADRLPPQSYDPVPPGKVVRTDLAGGAAFPARPVTVPANSKVRLLLQRDAMISAYPQLDVTGGAGASIKISWAEALYDAKMLKGDRDLIEDRKPVGIWDSFIADGQARTFAPLWWRTWRYAEIEVETKGQPLTLKAMRAFQTGYPFVQTGRFVSDDPDLARIFDVGWRTARLDAHETYMDTAYWEQLQYAGDTRLQMLISYAVSGDARLAEQAIDAFAASNVERGLMEAAYPTRSTNVIATFPLLWVGMLDDWRMRQRDPAPIVRHLDRMRTVLDWFERARQPSGLLGRNGLWNFIDWVGQPATDRDQFPSYGKSNESCLLSVSWLGALQQGARIEAAFGDKAIGAADQRRADALKQAIKERCWAPARGLFADNPDGDRFSQHMNALAILYDVVDQAEARAILDKIVAPGKGIGAPAGITPVSYYFGWYLAQAHLHAGLGDRYVGLLQTWRDLLKMHYTTWPEERDGAGQSGANASTRSDSHAWSAHPTADLLGIVAGIGPGAPGYATLKVAPNLADLKRIEATAATPSGPVSVRYVRSGGSLNVTVTRPSDLPGTFEWQGRSYPLTRTTTRLTISAASNR
jgi:hypothetical protein